MPTTACRSALHIYTTCPMGGCDFWEAPTGPRLVHQGSNSSPPLCLPREALACGEAADGMAPFSEVHLLMMLAPRAVYMPNVALHRDILPEDLRHMVRVDGDIAGVQGRISPPFPVRDIAGVQGRISPLTWVMRTHVRVMRTRGEGGSWA